MVIDTRLGPLEAEVTHDSKDRRWWAFLTRTPAPLRAPASPGGGEQVLDLCAGAGGKTLAPMRLGGPTLAVGETSSVALATLTVAIDEFLEERSA